MYHFLPIVLFLLLSTPCRLEETKMTRRQIIEYVNRNQTTWVAGDNFPEEMTFEEMKRLTGTIGVHPDPETMLVKTHKIPREPIPAYFDSRVNWPECSDVIDTIRNQGSCGSCWAFGAVEAMTDRLCIVTHGATKFTFSPEDLLECCADCVADKEKTCSGGYTGSAWNYLLNNGLVSGGDYNSNLGCKPYAESVFLHGEGPTVCQQSCQSGYPLNYDADKKTAISSYSLRNDVEQIQLEIMKNGPVTAIFQVFEDFYDYKHDVYQHVTGKYVGNHAVKIFGWGQEAVPFWWVANSWGNEWGGISGFFKILRGENHCGIEGSIVAGIPSA